jgi:ribosome-associated protein YbcJ (S4-like RNA binding protein)
MKLTYRKGKKLVTSGIIEFKEVSGKNIDTNK